MIVKKKTWIFELCVLFVLYPSLTVDYLFFRSKMDPWKDEDSYVADIIAVLDNSNQGPSDIIQVKLCCQLYLKPIKLLK